MNMLFSCLFGVGFVIVRYRKNGVLKRIKATPVTPLMFISAQMVSRFIIVIITSVVVFAGTNIFLGFTMKGSYFTLLLITGLAILCMISLGLIFAARIKSEELASGLMNLVTFPMIIFSGVFFSLEGLPKILQTFSKIFPLTHFVEGARDIMLEGALLVEVLPNVLPLAGMTILFLGIASLIFIWD
ncbi:MAG: ABC transporter permease [Spirochaetes bacterium]|nr:ABC transporter permease [Spirochaetota bacterium]